MGEKGKEPKKKYIPCLPRELVDGVLHNNVYQAIWIPTN